MGPMATVYIETSIPSYYFETRRSIQAVAWREATRRWWSRHRHRFELVTSAFVLNELAKAPAAKATGASVLLRGVEVLPNPAGIDEIISAYIRHRLMPADAVGDAAHLAVASMHGIDYVLTWNCKHLANASKARHIAVVNKKLGLSVPILTTPIGLVPEENLK